MNKNALNSKVQEGLRLNLSQDLKKGPVKINAKYIVMSP